MLETMDYQEEKYQRARDRVAALKKFYSKLVRSIIFLALFAGLNYYVNEWENPWFLWIALFTGIGLIIDAGKTFGVGMFLGNDWEERKIKEMMDKEGEDTTRTNRWE